ncbi:hypothetical protein ACFLS1_12025 [Verrucomicrobiota bacterium]
MRLFFCQSLLHFQIDPFPQAFGRWLGGTNGSINAYRIYRTTSMVDGVWDPITNYPRTNASGTNVWVDTDASNWWPNIFYKITAPTN